MRMCARVKMKSLRKEEKLFYFYTRKSVYLFIFFYGFFSVRVSCEIKERYLNQLDGNARLTRRISTACAQNVNDLCASIIGRRDNVPFANHVECGYR